MASPNFKSKKKCALHKKIVMFVVRHILQKFTLYHDSKDYHMALHKQVYFLQHLCATKTCPEAELIAICKYLV